MSNETKTDPLNDWFRKIGTSLSDEDYEAGIRAITAHDAAVAAKALREAAEGAKAIKAHAGGGNLVTDVRALTADALRARADRIEREGGSDV